VRPAAEYVAFPGASRLNLSRAIRRAPTPWGHTHVSCFATPPGRKTAPKISKTGTTRPQHGVDQVAQSACDAPKGSLVRRPPNNHCGQCWNHMKQRHRRRPNPQSVRARAGAIQRCWKHAAPCDQLRSHCDHICKQQQQRHQSQPNPMSARAKACPAHRCRCSATWSPNAEATSQSDSLMALA